MKLTRALFVAVIACGLAAASLQAGSGELRRPQSTTHSQVVIKRAANFGNQSNINLFIDGHRVATLGYGQSFKGALPAGLHLVTMMQTPHLNDAYPYSQQWIRLTPGRNSTFTAIWRGGGTRIALEES